MLRKKDKKKNKKPKPGKKQKSVKIVKIKVAVPREEYPHFRRYLKSGHPALITAEHSEDEYKFRKVMHSARDGKRLNEKVVPNPNPKDKNPMYIGKSVKHDKKKYFEKKKLPWKYPGKKDK